jgi:DNA replication protein DnaC
LPPKSFQPSIGPNQIRDLAASRWIAQGENVLVLGPPGRRQTHSAIALGREAILASYSVQFTTAMALVAGLAKARGESRSATHSRSFCTGSIRVQRTLFALRPLRSRIV